MEKDKLSEILEQKIFNDKYTMYIYFDALPDSEISCIIESNDRVLMSVDMDNHSLVFNITELSSVINSLMFAKHQFLHSGYQAFRQPVATIEDIYVRPFPRREGDIEGFYLIKDNRNIKIMRNEIDVYIKDLESIYTTVLRSINKILSSNYQDFEDYIIQNSA
jgi:hypothetical protein